MRRLSLNLNNSIAFLISVLVFLLIYQYADQNLRYLKHDFRLNITFPSAGEISAVAVETNGKKHGLGVKEVSSSEAEQDLFYLINGAPIERLVFNFKSDRELSVGEKLKVSSLQIRSPYSRNIDADSSDIGEYLMGGSSVVNSDKYNHFELNKDSNSVLLITRDISEQSAWVQYLLPIVIAGLVFVLFNGFAWGKFPAFADLNQGSLMANKTEFDTISGLRGLSALLVLLAHSGPIGYFSLQLGLALLFVVSGFLLCKPFVLDNTRIFKKGSLPLFWRKRILRILPMYYFAITLTILAEFEITDALQHYLLLEAKGHLWAIPQIFFFYLILPFVLLLTSWLHSYSRLFVLGALALAIAFHLPNYFLPHHMFYNGVYFTHFYAAQFLLGVFISYLYYGVISTSNWWNNHRDQLAVYVALIAYSLLIGFLLFVGPTFRLPEPIQGLQASFLAKSIVAAVLIVWYRVGRGI